MSGNKKEVFDFKKAYEYESTLRVNVVQAYYQLVRKYNIKAEDVEICIVCGEGPIPEDSRACSHCQSLHY